MASSQLDFLGEVLVTWKHEAQMSGTVAAGSITSVNSSSAGSPVPLGTHDTSAATSGGQILGEKFFDLAVVDVFDRVANASAPIERVQQLLVELNVRE